MARCVVPQFRPLSIYIALAATIGTIHPTIAQDVDDAAAGECACGYDQVAFDAADTDGDGFISEAELARDAAAGFSGLDRDGSETLTPQELGPHDPARFSRVDADGDGVLTFPEVMNNKVRALEDGDQDRDGVLSFDEIVDSVEAELGGQ